MQPKTKKYILDIESANGEIEATKKALDSNNSLVIANSQRIISLRNRLAHAYDSIQLSIIWSIAIKDEPKLKKELEQLRSN